MKSFLLSLSILTALACLFSLAASEPTVSQDEHAEWSNFKLKYKKEYLTHLEESLRRDIFLDNLRKMYEHNKSGESSFTVGVNKFADWTNEEYRRFLRSSSSKKFKFLASHTVKESELPSYDHFLDHDHTVDWRKKGAVTPIKDQAQCGSCYAFSATGALEGQNFLKHGALVNLSEQQIVDCSYKEGNQGCDGGLVEFSYDYTGANGSMTQDSYPYEGEDGPCRYNETTVAVRLQKYYVLPEGNEQELTKKIKKVGPVAVAIDASRWSFQFYSGGVYDEPKCGSSLYDLDHAVLAIGYGSDKASDKDYYLVKNSWGTDWGVEGYIKMLRNHKNQCGIATDCVIPVIV